MASATGAGGLSVGVTPVTYSGDCVNVTAGGCTASAIYAGDVNHYPSPTGQASIMITPATPTITVTGGNYAYDGNPHPATGVAKGINNLMVSGTFGFAYTPGGASVPTIPGAYSALGTFTSTSANYSSGGSGSTAINIGYGVCTAGPGGVVLPPLNSDGSSVYPRKGGSTIPVKFRVCAASGTSVSNPSAVFASGTSSISMLSAVRGTIDNVNESGVTDVPDVAFRWDASGQQWIFNMATSNLQSGNTYTFRINLADGYIVFVVGVSSGLSSGKNRLSHHMVTRPAFLFRKIGRRDAGEIRYGDFRLGNVLVPQLFPLETMITFVVGSSERLHLALDRDVAFAGEDVVALSVLRDGVFQVSVANPLAEFADGEFGLFVAVHKSVVRIPEQSGVRVIGFSQNLLEQGRGNEVAVGFDDDGDVVRLAVSGKLAHPGGYTMDALVAIAFEFVAVDADIGSVEFFSEINEAFGVGYAFCALVGIAVVHFGGRTEIGDFEAVRGDGFLRGCELVGCEFRAVR